MKPANTLTQVLAQTGPILLDFDGPICTVFATIPNHVAADQLRQVLTRHGVPLPRAIAVEPDPLAVLRYTATTGDRRLIAEVDDALRRTEQLAVDGATPTPYAREIIVAAYHAGRKLAIVSNNSEAAVRAYLAQHRLSPYLSKIIGRAHANPQLMKPHPLPVLTAVAALNAAPDGCLLLGDSTSDIAAGRAAGVRTIGYANKPGKYDRLVHAGADAVADGHDGMADLARLLHEETLII